MFEVRFMLHLSFHIHALGERQKQVVMSGLGAQVMGQTTGHSSPLVPFILCAWVSQPRVSDTVDLLGWVALCYEGQFCPCLAAALASTH